MSLTRLLFSGPFCSIAVLLKGKCFSGRCYWYLWSGWSHCQGACGAGVQKRIRGCKGCAPGTGACQGNSQQRRLL